MFKSIKPLRTRNLVLLAVTLFVFLACLTQGCFKKDFSNDPRVFAVFSDFVFVGTANYEERTSKEGLVYKVVGPHGERQQELPSRIDTGTEYIFHHSSPVDNEELALRILPARLRAAGAKINKAPSSPRELMSLIVGGPLFVIQFEHGGRVGLIFSSVHVQPAPAVSVSENQHRSDDDYVLVYLR